MSSDIIPVPVKNCYSELCASVGGTMFEEYGIVLIEIYTK